MIFTHQHLRGKTQVKGDVCIVGSGAGGSAAAAYLAAQGKKVIMLEGGSFLMPKDFVQKEEKMFPQLFFEAGGRRTSNRAIRILHGQGVGGSTLHNINLCKRAPDILLDGWHLKDLNAQSLRPFYQQVEKDLMVEKIPEELFNQNNLIFKRGVEALGLQGGGLMHNRQGCHQSGFCELGCSYNAKMNALRVYIPKVIENGGQVLANCRVQKLIWREQKVQGLLAQVRDAESQQVVGEVEVSADKFILSAGAIETPALMLRSQLPDPYKQIGKRLHLHPGGAVCALFDEQVDFTQGIPQSYECTEYLSFEPGQEDKRIWLVGGSAHPIGVAGLLPAFADEHRQLMQNFNHIASITPMLHDTSCGEISIDSAGDVIIRYEMDQSDRLQFKNGLKAAARILLAAGAKEAIIPARQMLRFKNPQEVEKKSFELGDLDLDVVAVHPMSSVWMGEDDHSSCVSSHGKYHHLENLFVADTSLYPTSLGVPPQISTYAIGAFVASHVY